MLKSVFRIFLATTMMLVATEAFAQAQRGKEVAAEFSWDTQNKSKFSFRLLSMDGKTRNYYVRVGDLYAPVQASTARSFDNIFFSATPVITFFKKSMDGKDSLFSPVFTVKVDKEKEDVLICLFEKDGSLVSKVVDISVKNLPAGAFAVVNLTQRAFGCAIGEKLLRVEPFEIAKQSFPTSDDIEDIPLKFYYLGKRPKLSYERYVSFIKSQNITFYIFDVPVENDDRTEAPYIMRYGKPPRKN